MKYHRPVLRLLVPLVCLLHVEFLPIATADEVDTKEVDRLFAMWDTDATPGGTVGVIRDGELVYERSFGMANLAHGVPNATDTRFHIASLSKQFTAFAVLLLAQDGKLSLDDDARKYVTELPDFGHTITIRHLLHHTSGMRDEPPLLWMAGWRIEDVVTMQDVLSVVSRQKELNSPPGEQLMYSNIGYMLLGVVVERVSEKALSQFMVERVFAPLGMNSTSIQNDYRELVPNLAESYQPQLGRGYRRLPLMDSTIGRTGVVTTLKDLALWDRNFDSASVGGRMLLDEMQQPGKLASGEETPYAAGVRIVDYRGLRIIEHSGSIAGYRNHYIRCPEERLSVIVMANTDDLTATQKAYDVVELYLRDKLKPIPKGAASPPAEELAKVTRSVEDLAKLVGDYEVEPGNFVSVSLVGDQLFAQGTGGGKSPIYAISALTFSSKDRTRSMTFSLSEAGQAESVLLNVQGKRHRAMRKAAAPLTDFVGAFYSTEVNAVYHVTLRDGKLLLRHPRLEMEMVRATPDTFELTFPLRRIRYERDSNGQCTRCLIDAERVEHMRFEKMNVATTAEK